MANAVWLEKHRAGPFFKLSYVRGSLLYEGGSRLALGLALAWGTQITLVRP